MLRTVVALRIVAGRHSVRAYSNLGQIAASLEASNAIVNSVRAERVKLDEHSHDGSLKGFRIAVKDNITTAKSSNLPTTAASRILSGHQSPFEATVVQLLRRHGATIDAKTNLDEFGMGSHSQNSAFGSVQGIRGDDETTLSPGGSSGGSAMSIAFGEYQVALGTDTGGSVRLPAAYTGVVGFKPTYGLLSRWGVIQYANSLDTVGILADSVANVEGVFPLISHFDEQDPTSLPVRIRTRISHKPRREAQGLRIGVPLEYCISELSNAVRVAYVATLSSLQSAGHRLIPVSLPMTRQALSAYYVLAPAEASSNLAKYDGIRYGQRSSGADSSPKEGLPLYARTRGAGFGEEVKRRILLGAYTLSSEAMDNYFIQAQKVRRLVQRDFDSVFMQPNPLNQESLAVKDDGVDVLITPTAPTIAPTIKEVRQQTPVESYMNDVFTVPASLAGLPAVSVPAPSLSHAGPGKVGIQVIGQFGEDDLVLRVGQQIEELVI